MGVQESGQDFQTHKLHDVEKDMLNGYGLYIIASRVYGSRKTIYEQNNPLPISNPLLKSDSLFLNGENVTDRPCR